MNETSKSIALHITTPEGIEFSLPLAGPLTRFLAWSIDAVCVLALVMISAKLLQPLYMLFPGFGMAILLLATFIIGIGYGIILEWFWRGQTLGKRVLRLRVMDEQGLKLKFSQVVIRNLLRFVDRLPVAYLVGGLACLVSRHAQRLGDFAASTIVVRQSKLTEPDLTQLLAGKFNSLRAHPHLAARLRQRASPGEAAIALQALVRRGDLDPEARLPLFQALAAHFRVMVEFPAAETEGISDEQYVRNVVDILYKNG
jgi:uncharacterized RDD family membrane protein YckC